MLSELRRGPHSAAANSLEGLLEFHGKAFADPPAAPVPFSHADVFMVWSWDVASDRAQPGCTLLENVSARGFRSAVRQWLPDGAPIPGVKLSIGSAPRLYPPGSTQTITYIRLRDGKVRHTTGKADPQGRLAFDLDGDAWEVGSAPRRCSRPRVSNWRRAHGPPPGNRSGCASSSGTRAGHDSPQAR